MNDGGDTRDRPLRAMTRDEVTAYVGWLDGEIARYEARRLELRAQNRVERAAEQECYRTALQEARTRLLAFAAPVGGA